MQQTRIGKIASERTQAEMQEKKTKETTDANFKKDVLDSDIPVMVDFWAPWCGCPIIEAAWDKVPEYAGYTGSTTYTSADLNAPNGTGALSATDSNNFQKRAD